MPDLDQVVDQIAAATSWDSSVGLIRQIPEKFGTGQHAEIYSRVAKRIYVPHLAPDFAYVYWREDYELEPFLEAYEVANKLTRSDLPHRSLPHRRSFLAKNLSFLQLLRAELNLWKPHESRFRTRLPSSVQS